MYKLKKFLPVLLIVAMLLWAGPAYAQARYGLTVTPVATDTASVLGAGTWVYGIGIYGSAATSILAVYDVATLPAVSNTNVKSEVGEALQYMSHTEWFKIPIYFSTAVTAVVVDGVGFIYSGPEPN